MNQPPQLQELLQLPAQERLRLARWLIDSTLEDKSAVNNTPDAEPDAPSPAAAWLLSIAGKFSSGKPSNSAERHEEILLAEVDKVRGFGGWDATD